MYLLNDPFSAYVGLLGFFSVLPVLEIQNYESSLMFETEENNPDRATMRPDSVSTCIEHVTYKERQMDDLTDEMTE